MAGGAYQLTVHIVSWITGYVRPWKSLCPRFEVRGTHEDFRRARTLMVE